MKHTTVIFLIFIAFSYTYADEIKLNSAADFTRKQHRLITSLFKGERYFDCIAETGRLLQYTSDRSLIPEYAYFISLNYYLGHQYASAADRLPGAGTKGHVPHLRDALLRSRSFVKLGTMSQAIEALENIPYDALGEKSGYDLFIRKTELLLLNDNYQHALDEISLYEKYSPREEAMNNLRNDISRYRSLGTKSASLSVALSAALPGAGQAYCGRYSEALLSFTAVAMSGAATWYAMDRGEKPLAMTLGFFTVLLYSGNLYGAYNATTAYNKNLYNSFRSGVISTHVPNYDPMSYIDMEKVFK
jgi:hypothetical protein